MYLTYQEYYEQFDGKLEESLFNRYLLQAECYIDDITDYALSNLIPVHERVKACVFELIGLFELEIKTAQNQTISSVSHDGVSVSYVNGSDNFDALRYKTVLRYLSGVKDSRGIPVLYRGV